MLYADAVIIPNSTAITVSSNNELKILSDIVNGIHTNQAQQSIQSDFSGYIVVLTNDLTFAVPEEGQSNFTPIGKDDSHTFNGTFDGQEYTISKLKINMSGNGSVYAGLFGYLNSGTTVKDLKINDSEISATSTNGIASSGGIAGDNYGTITNCYNLGAATESAYSGGIAGSNYGTITNCYNNGIVTGTANYSGGIAGWNYQGTITNCYNNGIVTGTANYSGGIAGLNWEGTITNCYNRGILTGSSYLGGIAGKNTGGTIENCYNTGTVTGSSYSGGIVGSNDVLDTDMGTITKCYNNGIVTGTGDYSGGIAGDNYGTITNCYNLGAVTASTYSGGIAGYNSEKIMNCYNTGTLTASTYSGGIAGGNSNNGTITNCYNTGTVTASGTLGGIVGANSSEGTIQKCYYLNSCVSNDTGVGIGLNSTDMTGLNLLKDTNNLNGEQDPLLWSPDIFEVNGGYPILADVPTQIDTEANTNKPPQSAVYITLDNETSQALEYSIPIIKTNGESFKATANIIEIKTTPPPSITSYKWYMMEDISKVKEGSSCDLYHGTYYVKITSSDGYSYTSLTRTILNTLTVTFNSNGGSGVDSITIDGGKTISKPADPTKENCKFAGWYTSDDNGNTLSKEWDFSSNKVTENVTLYAKWEAKAEVTVKLDNTTWNEFKGEVYLYQNDKTKYTLSGYMGVYSADVDLGEYQIWVKMNNTDVAVDTNVPIDLRNGNESAEVKYWTVTFNLSENQSELQEVLVLNNSPVKKPTTDPTRIGYTFKEWCSDNKLTTPYQFDTPVANDITLYAKWEEIEYSIEYNDNNGTGGDVPTDDTKYKINEQITLKSNEGTLVKSGYVFSGWNYTSNASSALPLTILLDEAVIKDYINSETKTLTLYAVWELDEYQIKYYDGDDELTDLIPTSYTIKSDVELPTASKIGYTFVGWFEKGSETEFEYVKGTTVGDISLYAKWEEIEYSIEYNDNNGTGGDVPTDDTKYKINEQITLKSNEGTLVKSGYVFSGWNYTSNASSALPLTILLDEAVIKDYINSETKTLTLYAYWTSTGGSGGSGGVPVTPPEEPVVEKEEVNNEDGTISSITETTVTKENDDGSKETTIEKEEVVKDKDGNVQSVIEEKQSEVVNKDGSTNKTSETVVKDKDGKVIEEKTEIEIEDKNTGVSTSVEVTKGSDGKTASEITTQTSVETKDGKAQVSSEVLNEALKQAEAAKNAAEEKGAKDAKPVIEIEAENSEDFTETEISAEDLSKLAEAEVDVKIKTATGEVNLPPEVSKNLSSNADEKVSLSFGEADKQKLTEEQKKTVGDAPVFEFNLKSGEKDIHDLGGTVKVTVPYELKAGEDPNKITVWYIDEQGNPVAMNSVYDPETKSITFETSHFSYYFIAEDTAVPDDKKDDSNNTKYYAVAAVIVILIIIALAYYFMKKKQ